MGYKAISSDRYSRACVKSTQRLCIPQGRCVSSGSTQHVLLLLSVGCVQLLSAFVHLSDYNPVLFFKTCWLWHCLSSEYPMTCSYLDCVCCSRCGFFGFSTDWSCTLSVGITDTFEYMKKMWCMTVIAHLSLYSKLVCENFFFLVSCQTVPFIREFNRGFPSLYLLTSCQ